MLTITLPGMPANTAMLIFRQMRRSFCDVGERRYSIENIALSEFLDYGGEDSICDLTFSLVEMENEEGETIEGEEENR